MHISEAYRLMGGVRAYHVQFEVESVETVRFGGMPGSALRGALYHALSRQFCPDAGARHLPRHQSACPVCWLLATEDPEQRRGRNLPHPLAIRPAQDGQAYEAGTRWAFGVTLVGDRARASLPHLVRAVQQMGAGGVGQGRGQFKLVDVRESNPLLRTRHSLLRGPYILSPGAPVTAEMVREVAATHDGGPLSLHLLTPLRVGEDGRLMTRPDLRVIIRRLLERCQAMATHFGEPVPPGDDPDNWRAAYLHLSEAAGVARLTVDETSWVDGWSGSRRTGRVSPVGGLVGRATWEDVPGALLPWLLWGQSLQVGKSTVKGNGWYVVERF
ncbi:MAG: CRISPR system precrRNA processing endoribonuclease RAMP protein Cas6 [Anaerolineae bacterium]